MGLLICPVTNWIGKREFERTDQTENRIGDACAPIISRTSRWELREQKYITGSSAGAPVCASLHGDHPPAESTSSAWGCGLNSWERTLGILLTSLAKQVSCPPSRYLVGLPLISSLMWSLAMWLALFKRMPHLRSGAEHLSEFWEMVEDRGAWRATVHGVAKSWTWLSDWTTTTTQLSC